MDLPGRQLRLLDVEPLLVAAAAALAAAPAFDDLRYARVAAEMRERLGRLERQLARELEQGGDPSAAPSADLRKRLGTTVTVVHSLTDPDWRQRSEEFSQSDAYRAHKRAVRRLGLQPQDVVPLLTDPAFIEHFALPRGWYNGAAVCNNLIPAAGLDATWLHELIHSAQPSVPGAVDQLVSALNRAPAGDDDRARLEAEIAATTTLIEGATQLLTGFLLDPKQTLPPITYGGDVECLRQLAGSKRAAVELAQAISLEADDVLGVLGRALGRDLEDVPARRELAAEVNELADRLAQALGELKWDARAELGLLEKAQLRRRYARYRQALAQGQRLVWSESGPPLLVALDEPSPIEQAAPAGLDSSPSF